MKFDRSKDIIYKHLSKLWSICMRFRGQVPIHDFIDVFVGLFFYRIISEQVVNTNKLYLEKVRKSEIDKNDIDTELLEYQEKRLGYSISKEHLYNTLLELCFRNDSLVLMYLEENLYAISKQFKDSKIGIFEFVISNLRRFSTASQDLDRIHYELLHFIDHIFTDLNTSDYDFLFENIIKLISFKFGKKEVVICTPKTVSTLINELVNSRKKEINELYDPTFGTGSLAMSIFDGISVSKVYGYEISPSIYNIARMNLIIKGVKGSTLILGNSLEENIFTENKFDVIVSHPPFNQRWDNTKWLYRGTHKHVPPKNSASYAYVLQMLRQLKDDGIMTIILPHGVLFRGNIEKKIREGIIENNYLDAVIGLPQNLFYETNIPLCLLVFRKNKEVEDVFFIDASSDFQKKEMKTYLADEHIKKIMDTYIDRINIKGYSSVVSLDKIRNSDYNLSIHKYVDIFRIDMLMKNYNFSKIKLSDVSEIMRFKESEEVNQVILRATTPKVINSEEEISGNYSNYISILPNEEFLYAEYLEYFFSTHISQTLFESISTGISRNISITELRELEIPIPEKDIQMKLVKSQNRISETINELIEYRDRLVNNPEQVNDLTYKLEELRGALKINNRIDSIKKEISRGETLHVEFKRDFSSCEEKIIKTIYAFLNTEGGKIYIGVDNEGHICGLDENEEFDNTDDLILKFTNKFRDKVPEYLAHADIEVLIIDNKTVLLLTCIKSRIPVFRKKKDKSKFFVRKFSSSECINDVEEVIKFVQNRFH